MSTSPSPYVYSAFVTSVYDGDTLTANVDLGMSITRKCICRLAGLDTPEIKSKTSAEKEAAEKARDRVKELVLGKSVTLQSMEKPDKYGRLLVKIWTPEGVCLNDVLIQEHLAHNYNGGTKESWGGDL